MDKRKITIRAFIFIFFIFGYLYSKNIVKNRKGKLNNVDKFLLSVYPKAIEGDSIEIFTLLEIPYYSIQFVKKKKSFVGSYNLSISLQDNSGKEIGHKIWSDSLILSSYKDTRAKLINRKYIHSFIIAKDRYKISAQLLDNDTRKKGSQDYKIDYSGLKKTPEVFEPYFLIGKTNSWEFTNNNLPRYGNRVKGIEDSIGICISGFIEKGEYDILLRINEKTQIGVVDTFSRVSPKNFFQEIVFIESNRFDLVNNRMKVTIIQKKKTKSNQTVLRIYKPGISQYVYDIDLGIKQMRYLLYGEKRKMFKGKNKSEKEQLFYNFWKSKDPTPATESNELMEEYYRRVAYSNENFNSWGQGWETDMGMIYILFGSPDEVQRSNPTSSSQTIYQIWSYYSINKQFIFKDLNGFGDFRLDSPFIGSSF